MWPTTLARGPPRHDPEAVRFRSSPRAPQKVLLRERRDRVVKLRQLGFNYEQVAGFIHKESEERAAKGEAPLCAAGYDRWDVFKDLRHAMAEMAAKFELNAESLRQVEIARAEEAFRVAWSFVEDRNPKDGKPMSLSVGERLAAIDRALRASERLAQLRGLDAPTKVAPTTPDGKESWRADELTDEERAARIRALLEGAQARLAKREAQAPAPEEGRG